MNCRRTLFVLCMAVGCHTFGNAQENPGGNYLQQTGKYAEIYNGRMEANYNVLLYDNLPYYKNPDFTETTLIYRNSYYPRQKVRLDLYREELIIFTPDDRFGIILNPSNVQKAIMYDKTFLWLNPEKESGLKPGYYICLSEGKKIQLFCKESYSLLQNQISLGFDRKRYYSFSHAVRYYLLYNNQYYLVKNKDSFSKLFPQYKKQINRFAKEHQLKFKKETKEAGFISLAGRCEELITSTSTQ